MRRVISARSALPGACVVASERRLAYRARRPCTGTHLPGLPSGTRWTPFARYRVLAPPGLADPAFWFCLAQPSSPAHLLPRSALPPRPRYSRQSRLIAAPFSTHHCPLATQHPAATQTRPNKRNCWRGARLALVSLPFLIPASSLAPRLKRPSPHFHPSALRALCFPSTPFLPLRHASAPCVWPPNIIAAADPPSYPVCSPSPARSASLPSPPALAFACMPPLDYA